MTQKEKSKELLHKYWNSQKRLTYKMAKQCALIAVDEIIKELITYRNFIDDNIFEQRIKYYTEVKTEITKL